MLARPRISAPLSFATGLIPSSASSTTEQHLATKYLERLYYSSENTIKGKRYERRGHEPARGHG